MLSALQDDWLSCMATQGKVHVFFCRQAVQLVADQKVMILCVWEGNHGPNTNRN